MKYFIHKMVCLFAHNDFFIVKNRLYCTTCRSLVHKPKKIDMEESGNDEDFITNLSQSSVFSFNSVMWLFEETGRDRSLTEKCLKIWANTGVHPSHYTIFKRKTSNHEN